MSDLYLTIDRDFGNWFAGFTDGEGSFGADIRKSDRGRSKSGWGCHVRFTIALRLDDKPILEEIQRQLGGIGSIYDVPNKTKYPNGKPAARWHVARIAECQLVLVPFFTRYQLRAKKRRGFIVWRELIRLVYGISLRRKSCVLGHSKWYPEELQRFRDLRQTLQSVREYDAVFEERVNPQLQLFA